MIVNVVQRCFIPGIYRTNLPNLNCGRQSENVNKCTCLLNFLSACACSDNCDNKYMCLKLSTVTRGAGAANRRVSIKLRKRTSLENHKQEIWWPPADASGRFIEIRRINCGFHIFQALARAGKYLGLSTCPSV